MGVRIGEMRYNETVNSQPLDKGKKEMANDVRVNDMVQRMTNNVEFMDILKAAATSVVTETGDPSFARFMQAMTEVCRNDIKSVIGDVKSAMRPEKVKKAKASKAPVDNSWRGAQKEAFSGRGRQWIYVPVEAVEAYREGSEVHEFFDAHGKAWVRYVGPRIEGDVKMAAFEVRTSGSKVPMKNYIMIPHDDVMVDEVDRLEDGKTPNQLGLEATKVEVESEEESEAIDIKADEVEDESIPVEMLGDDEEEDLDDSIF